MKLRMGAADWSRAGKIKLILAASFWATLGTAIPSITFPINSQVPPVARASQPFSFTFSHSTFMSQLPLTYTLSNAPIWLSLDGPSRTLSGTPPATAADTAPIIHITATDSTGSVMMSSTLVVSGKLAPQILIPLKDQLPSFGTYSAPSSILFYPSTPFKFSFSPETFTSGLNHYAVTSDGNAPLPSWVTFDNATLSFSGQTPDSASLIQPPQDFGIQLIASDVVGFSTSAAIPFHVIVERHKLAFDVSFLTMNVLAGVPVDIKQLSGSLRLDGAVTDSSNLSSVNADVPSWLTFDKSTLSLKGIPPGDATPYNVTITAVDLFGDTAVCIIYVQITNSTAELFVGAIGTLNATIGMQFSHSFNSSFKNASAVLVSAVITPPTAWLSFDSQTLILSGNVPSNTKPSSINVTLWASTKSKRFTESQTFAINIISALSSTLSSSQVSTPASKTSSSTISTVSSAETAANGAAMSSSGGGLSSETLAAAIVVPIIVLIIAILVILCCCRHRRQSKRERATSPAKSLISGPVLVDIGQVPPANLSAENFHPELMREVSESEYGGTTFLSQNRPTAPIRRSLTDSRLQDAMSTNEKRNSNSTGGRGRSLSQNALSSLEGSWRSTQGSVYPTLGSMSMDASSRMTRNFSRKAGVTRLTRDDSSEFPVRHSNQAGTRHLPLEDSSEFPNRISTMSSEPFRRIPEGRSSIQQTPDFAYDVENSGLRRESLRRTPNYPGGSLSVGKRQSGVGHGYGNSMSGPSTTGGSRYNGAVGHGYGAPELPRDSNSWLTIGTVETKSRRPQSAMSAVTESTDVLFAPGSPVRKTIRMVEISPNVGRPANNRYSFSSSSHKRPVSRRTAGAAPFFMASSSSTNSRATSRKSIRRKLTHLPNLDDDASAILDSTSQNENLETSVMRQLRTSDPLERSREPSIDPLGIDYGDPEKGTSRRYSNPREGTLQLKSFMSGLSNRLSWHRESMQFSDADSRFRSADRSPESPEYRIHDDEDDYSSHSAQNGESLRSFRDSKGDIVRYLKDGELPEIGQAGEASIERPSLLLPYVRNTQSRSPGPPSSDTRERYVSGPERRPVSVDADLTKKTSFVASQSEGVSDQSDEERGRRHRRSNRGSDVENDDVQAFL